MTPAERALRELQEREHIQAAIAADASLDETLARYAELGRTFDLAEAIDRSTRVYAALVAEACRIGRSDLIAPPTPLYGKHP
jgi:hypothetical protein